MNPGDQVAKGSRVIWQADLTLECEGRVTARLRADSRECTLEITDRQALQALAQSFKSRSSGAGSKTDLSPLAALLPEAVDLRLSGVLIGRYEPAAPSNVWARTVGLPGGRLTIHKLALARAWLL